MRVITNRSAQNFQRMYLKYFNEKLSDEEAMRKAQYLIEIYKVVYNTPSVVDFFNNKKKEE